MYVKLYLKPLKSVVAFVSQRSVYFFTFVVGTEQNIQQSTLIAWMVKHLSILLKCLVERISCNSS